MGKKKAYPVKPGFMYAPIIVLPKRVPLYGSGGKLEVFAILFEEHVLGSLVHLHIVNKGEEPKSLEKHPYQTYLLADCPEFARQIIRKEFGV